MAAHDRLDPLAGERLETLRSESRLEVAQGVRRERVVGLRELAPTGVGEGVDLGRATAAALAHRPVGRPLGCLHEPVGLESVEVTAHGRGCQRQLLGQHARRGRALLEEQADHAVAGARVGLHDLRALLPDFHHTIVP